MVAQGIAHGSVLLTLIAPIVAAVLLGITFFFKAKPEQFEKITFHLVRIFNLMTAFSALLALVSFLWSGIARSTMSFAQIHIGPEFLIDMRVSFDLFGLIFLFTCTLITAVITFFSHRYLHRDPGYRRFFLIISLFAFGINLIIVAGVFDLLFLGWEIVGLSSFLLIGYFWHRPKAIGAALRAFSIYRICDLGFLGTILITHFLWHDASIFGQGTINIATPWRWLLCLSILMPVLGKSAQFPFCFWLPRAMEGPTHSSAIFYGSLSIHVGVFLMIRTSPIWYGTPGFTYGLFAIGLITALSASLFALVQSNIKGQIGYASIAQVGLMLVELSLGLTTIAFIHMIGNALLRCFQLLVSSSILAAHLQMQSVVRTFGQINRQIYLPRIFPKRWKPSLYIFAINEGFYEVILKKAFVHPTLLLAKFCNRLLTFNWRIFSKSSDRTVNFMAVSPIMAILCSAAVLDILFRSHETIRLISLIVSLILALGALGEQRRASQALMFAIFANLFAFLSIISSRSGLLYLIGLVTSSIVAIEALQHITRRRTIPELRNFHGLFQQFPRAGTMFLIGILGIVSFPFSSTFFGEDILLHLSFDLGLHYLWVFQFIFVISGIAVIRLYSHIMFGRRDNMMPAIDLDMSALQTLLRFLMLIAGNVAAFALAIT